MTEVLLLLVAILLSLACGAFVAAEFSLTTVDRGELERAVVRGERGAAGALRAVRQLTFQLSGAQLGITVTNLVVGMLAEPSIAKLLAGPLEAVGIARSAASSLALVIGTALSTVFLMVVGELVPKNWAISSPLAVAKRVGNAQRWFSAAFRPFITHLNNTANRLVRRFGLEPAEELASARGPQELAALARHSAKKGSLEADTAELFVRTLNLADLTAENVMTPRVQVVALEVHATCEDVANATRATGLSRFPVYRESLDTVVGTAHIKDILALPVAERGRVRVAQVMREPLLVPESLTVDRLLEDGWARLAVPDPFVPYAAPEHLNTRTGKIQIQALELEELGLDSLPVFIPPAESPSLDAELARRYPLALLSPPEHQFLNSTFVNVPGLRQAAGEAKLLLHPNEAAVRGVRSGDRVRIWNDRGHFFALATVTDGVRPGVAASYGVRWARLSEGGLTVNDTTAQRLSDMGGGSTFYDNAVEVELAPAAAPQV